MSGALTPNEETADSLEARLSARDRSFRVTSDFKTLLIYARTKEHGNVTLTGLPENASSSAEPAALNPSQTLAKTMHGVSFDVITTDRRPDTIWGSLVDTA